MSEGNGMRRFWPEVMVFAATAAVELTDAGIATLSKAAMSEGMSPFVFVFYYNALGTFFLLFPFLFYRAEKRPPLTVALMGVFFLLGLIGIWSAVLAFIGIRYSSPILCSALINLIPAFTFILAVIFKMEKLDPRSRSSQVKSIGAVVSISGALIVTLYKGPPLMLKELLVAPSAHSFLGVDPSTQSNWVLGGILLSSVPFLAAAWNILQTTTLKKYPSHMVVVFFYCFFGTLQCALTSFIMERDPNAWKLKSQLQLIAVIFAAVFGTVFRTGVHTWGLHKKGPVYVAMFRPLEIVFTVVLSVTFLGDSLHIGSALGAIVIALGFYGVIWGKAKEEKKREDIGVGNYLESSAQSQHVPLLRSND